MTFTLSGFSVVKRGGIGLTGTFTATVNAVLQLGALEESITVTGETPIVDVHGTTRQQVLGREIIDTIPAGRSAFQLAVLIPGVALGTGAQDVGGSGQNTLNGLVAHGSRYNDQASMQNGVSIAAMSDAGWASSMPYNPVATQEIVIDTSAVNVELPSGGVRVNVITRDGGNAFNATWFANYASNALQGDNFTPELQAAGLQTPSAIQTLWDINPGAGGPLKRDTLWFYASGRYTGVKNYVGGLFANAHANDPTVWTYAPDPSSRPVSELVTKDGQLRLTWQASAKNKIGVVWREQTICGCPAGLGVVAATLATNAVGHRRLFPLQRLIQVDWTSPLTSRVLLEAGGVHYQGNSTEYPLEGLDPRMITVVEQSNGLTYRGNDPYRERPNLSHHYRTALSYVTGTHAFKGGINHTSGHARTRFFTNQPVSYRFNSGVPNQITQFAYPFLFQVNVDHNFGIFAQDKWTVARMTVTGGFRYDYYSNSFPDSTLGPTPFTPTRNATFPAQDNLRYHDITPRAGVSYDLFGNGKTALKATVNKYLQSLGTIDLAAMPHPVANSVLTTTRRWDDANRDFVPDCTLTSPAANGECGAMANPNFGTISPGASFDPDILTGWGKRGYNWEFSTGVQQEIVPRVAIDVGFFRRWYGNQMVTDNRAVTPADFTPFSVTAPADPRLPGGGGNTVSGLYNLNPNKFGIPAQNYVTFAKNYGGLIDHWNGVDVNTTARVGRGMLLQGGFSTGRRTTDMCEVAARLPLWLTTGAGERANTLVQSNAPSFVSVGAGRNLDLVDPAGTLTPAQFCSQDSGWRTQVKLLGSYTVPRIDVLVSGTFQSLPGPQVAAYYVATNAEVAPSLGRPLSGQAANVTVNLVEPGSLYGERLNQLDVRVGKMVRVGRTRAVLNLDVYNALNAGTVLSLNSNYGAWLQPTAILTARFAKVSVQVDF